MRKCCVGVFLACGFGSLLCVNCVGGSCAGSGAVLCGNVDWSNCGSDMSSGSVIAFAVDLCFGFVWGFCGGQCHEIIMFRARGNFRISSVG